jgi:hypothetical protein
VTYYRQPWGRLTVTGRRCRLQVLDPITAFELEPELIDRFGEPLVMLLAARGNVVGSLWSGVLADHGFTGTIGDAVRDREQGLDIAADGVRRTVEMLTACAVSANLEGRWLAQVFERMVFDRLKVDDVLVEDWTTWAQAGLGPFGRWQVLAFQIEQTFQPLWIRKPYSLRSPKSKDYGVPVPGVATAVQWAANLAKMGYVASSHEVLTDWTPVALMDQVDIAAHAAEVERRAMDATSTAKK